MIKAHVIYTIIQECYRNDLIQAKLLERKERRAFLYIQGCIKSLCHIMNRLKLNISKSTNLKIKSEFDIKV